MDENEILSNHYWQLNKFLLKIVGLWPYQTRNVKIWIRVSILFVIHTMMIPQIIRTFEEWGKDSNIVIENISGFFYFHAIIVKYVACILTESKLQYLYEQISGDWKEFSEEGEQNVLRHFANQGRQLTIGYCVYLYAAGISFSILPWMIPTVLDFIVPINGTRQKILCYYGEYFIDQEVYYYQLLLHTFICVMSTVILFTSIDTTYVCAIQHIIGLFNIVESAELLQSTYTMCFLVTMGETLMCLCFGIVDLMMSINNYINFFKLLAALAGVVIYIFFISIPGQKIYDSSLNILNSLYSSGWYNFPLKTQRLLKFMMMRCHTPCQLTAGPFLILNLENCGVVLKTTMSYCTFVLSMS